MRAPLLLAAAAAVARLAGAQDDATVEHNREVVNDCRARLPPGTVFNVLEGLYGEAPAHNLVPTTPGVLSSAPSACAASFGLNVHAKHVS